MHDDESDAPVLLDVFEGHDLMFVNVFEWERCFRSRLFRFEVDVFALIDSVIIRGGRYFIVCLANLCGTAALIINLYDLDGNRFFVDVGDVV